MPNEHSFSDDEAAILRLLKDREAAIHNGDARAALAPLADDVVVYDLPPPLTYEGAEARDAAALEDWFGTWDGPVTTQTPDPRIFIDGDLAVAFGLTRLQGDKKGEGPQDVWLRSTAVLRREETGWRIFHQHQSFPMMMDGSQKAAIDLKP